MVRGIKGALCGSGDMSIGSFPGPGDEDGTGGVVELSVEILIMSSHTVCLRASPRLMRVLNWRGENKARRGVGF